jgi:AcrR family transcriptional regulator
VRRWETVPRKGRDLFRHPLAPATLAVLRERGYADATVAEFCARAGVRRAELPRRFRFKALLCLAVSEAYVGDFKARVRAAFDGGGEWPGSLRAAAYETLRWIADHPDAAWWGTVGVLEVGEVGRARRDEVFGWAATLIEAGREVAPDPDAVPRSASTMAVGAIVETLGRRVQGSLLDDPVAAVPRMMYGAVLPYLGEEVALRELEVPAPAGFPAEVGPRIVAAFDDAAWQAAAMPRRPL